MADFSKLDSLGRSEQHSEANKEKNISTEYNSIEMEKNALLKQRKAWADYQENIKRSGMLRADILKGIQSKRDPVDVLLIACECISRMTDDKVYFKQAERDIKKNYKG